VGEDVAAGECSPPPVRRLSTSDDPECRPECFEAKVDSLERDMCDLVRRCLSDVESAAVAESSSWLDMMSGRE